MTDKYIQEVYSEVYSILNELGEDYTKKIPDKLLDTVEKEKLDEYNPKYILKDLNNQKIKRESLAMIALLYLNYWCVSEQEKEKLKEILKENDRKYQEKIREKYNLDDIFNKNKRKNEINNNVQIIQYKKTNIFRKIIDKIKNILKIN